jgi:hypothetical protein
VGPHVVVLAQVGPAAALCEACRWRPRSSAGPGRAVLPQPLQRSRTQHSYRVNGLLLSGCLAPIDKPSLWIGLVETSTSTAEGRVAAVSTRTVGQRWCPFQSQLATLAFRTGPGVGRPSGAAMSPSPQAIRPCPARRRRRFALREPGLQPSLRPRSLPPSSLLPSSPAYTVR